MDTGDRPVSALPTFRCWTLFCGVTPRAETGDEVNIVRGAGSDFSTARRGAVIGGGQETGLGFSLALGGCEALGTPTGRGLCDACAMIGEALDHRPLICTSCGHQPAGRIGNGGAKLPVTESVGAARHGETFRSLVSSRTNMATCLEGWPTTSVGSREGRVHPHCIPGQARTCPYRSDARHPLWTTCDPAKASGPFVVFSWTCGETGFVKDGGLATRGDRAVCDDRHPDCHGPFSWGVWEGSGRERSGGGRPCRGSEAVCLGRALFGAETCGLRGGGEDRRSGSEIDLWAGPSLSRAPTGRPRRAESGREPSRATA